MPEQRHPSHMHQFKDETWTVLWGTLEAQVNGRMITLARGETVTIPANTWHSFRTQTGAVFEETQTKDIASDTQYEDPALNRLPSAQRKTFLTLTPSLIDSHVENVIIAA